jgi:hypothetical protein
MPSDSEGIFVLREERPILSFKKKLPVMFPLSIQADWP